MRIIKLTAENFKRLTAIEISPKGNTIVITGKNGAGKSSVLDAILVALCGKRFCPDKPVREGEKKAKIVVDMDEYIATRTFTKDGGGTVKLETKYGKTITSPQAFLDKLVGKISFDPLAFVEEPDPKKQRKILLDLVGIDLDKSNEAIAELRGERQVINRERTRIKGLIINIPVVPDAPTEKVSFVELTQQLTEAKDKNARIKQESNTIGVMQREKIEHIKRIADLDAAIEAGKQWLKENPAVDTVALTEQIANAEKTNVLVRQGQQRETLKKDLQIQDELYASKGEELDGIEERKAQMLRKCKMPVEGLSVDETDYDGVTFNGIPIAQIAQSEKLKVGVAVSMALNPKLRVLRIIDGSLLDSENLKTIAEMVKDKDYQIWIERVDETGKVGVFIEDGAVKK